MLKESALTVVALVAIILAPFYLLAKIVLAIVEWQDRKAGRSPTKYRRPRSGDGAARAS